MTLACEPDAGIGQKGPGAVSRGGAAAQALFDTAGATRPGSVLRRAYDVAAVSHEGQLRLSGDAYLSHPVEVALICKKLGMSPEVWCAALLHDVIADTACTSDQLRREFGCEIAGLVEEVTRLDRSRYRSAAAALDQVQAVGDPRVLVIKLADRLHNMRTLRYLPPAKQQRKCREVLECFAPLARGLGLDAMAQELADLAYQTLAQNREDQATQSTSASDRAPVLSRRVLAITAVLLPRAGRGRWLSEWTGELTTLPTRRRRARFTIQMLAGMPRLAAVLRYQVTSPIPGSGDGSHMPVRTMEPVLLPPEPSNAIRGETS
jgi:HD domain